MLANFLNQRESASCKKVSGDIKVYLIRHIKYLIRHFPFTRVRMVTIISIAHRKVFIGKQYKIVISLKF